MSGVAVWTDASDRTVVIGCDDCDWRCLVMTRQLAQAIALKHRNGHRSGL